MKTLFVLLCAVTSVAVMAIVPAMPASADVGACKDLCLDTGTRCETACDGKCNDPGRLHCLRDCKAACRDAQTTCTRACDGN